MPKQKTHKGLKKRVKVTASGKVKYKRSFGSHLMRSKNAKRRRHLASTTLMSGAMARKSKVMLCS